MTKSIGIIGLGSFGTFMALQLAKHADVVAYDLHELPVPTGVRRVGLDEALRQWVVILAIPVQAMEAFLREHAHKLQPDSLVIDVASVKTVPVELMKKYVPRECEILASHPLFGPQSGAKGIAGLTVVTWPVRVSKERYRLVRHLLTARMGLVVREVSPEEHDREMAYVQALTFNIGRALDAMGIPDSKLKTATYQHLLDIRAIVAGDSDELYKTIQEYNPYAGEIRKAFRRELADRTE